MGRLNFNDIADWTPTSISIVDRPDHPLAVFEVYEDDDEFVKKSINIDDNMSNEENMKDETISISQSFFEKLEEKPDEEEDPVPGTVTKNETTSGNDSGTNEIVDDTKVVTKSREVDPDKITATKSEKTFYERIGRKSNGMTW